MSSNWKIFTHSFYNSNYLLNFTYHLISSVYLDLWLWWTHNGCCCTPLLVCWLLCDHNVSIIFTVNVNLWFFGCNNYMRETWNFNMLKPASGRKHENCVWKYFVYEASVGKSRWMWCVNFGQNLVNHLKSKHKDIAAELEVAEKSRKQDRASHLQLRVIQVHQLYKLC